MNFIHFSQSVAAGFLITENKQWAGAVFVLQFMQIEYSCVSKQSNAWSQSMNLKVVPLGKTHFCAVQKGLILVTSQFWKSTPEPP